VFGRIQNIDDRVLERILKIHKPALDKTMILFSKAGTFGTVWWLICMPFLFNQERRVTGINFVLGLAIVHLMGQMLIKNIVKRARPCHRLDDDDLIVDRPRYYSFPSGHTAASFAFVGVALMRCGLLFTLSVLLLASLISFSRIYLRVHYLTDVVAGVLLGLLCGVGSVLIMNSVFPMLFPNFPM
jgi:undecaprenyl-diphosphatase